MYAYLPNIYLTLSPSLCATFSQIIGNYVTFKMLDINYRSIENAYESVCVYV